MAFIDFLYANLTLTAPPGEADRVLPIRAHRGRDYVSGYYQFSDEELAEINKTGGLWLSFLCRQWPPVQVNAWVPAHRADAMAKLRVMGPTMLEIANTRNLVSLFYLDLALLFMQIPEDRQDFIWRERTDIETVEDWTGPVYDLEYREKTSSVHSGGEYLFSEALEVLGRFKDLPKLGPLSYIFPVLAEPAAANYLVLAPKELPTQRVGAQIITLQ